MIALDDVVLRDDLDPRLGERDDDLIAQYADIFDALPPIEINQHNEVIDGWHRVRAAEQTKRTAIAYVVVETDGDEDLRDRMYAANLRHGVQYSREQKRAYGATLHKRELSAKEIARLSGVGVSTVYRWTRELREQDKEERDVNIHRLRDEGYSQQEIADELQVAQRTVSEVLSENSQMRKTAKQSETKSESETEPEIESLETETGEVPEADLEEIAQPDPEPAETETEEPEPALELLPMEPASVEAPTEEVSASDDPEREPFSPELIPDDILAAARAVMGTFDEARPDDYVVRLEASPSEWLTITDDSLSNELERELLTSAAAMCLWQEWMVWYQGGRTNAFTDAFGKIGPVFVRGVSGQWTIVTRLRSILRRLWA